MNVDVIKMKIAVWERKVNAHKRIIARLQAELDKVTKWLKEDELKLSILREKLEKGTTNAVE